MLLTQGCLLSELDNGDIAKVYSSKQWHTPVAKRCLPVLGSVVEKLCLAGPDLADTKLYHDYLEHGKIWYVVFEAQKRGIMVGIARNCVITLFSKSAIEEFIDYIVKDFLMLIE